MLWDSNTHEELRTMPRMWKSLRKCEPIRTMITIPSSPLGSGLLGHSPLQTVNLDLTLQSHTRRPSSQLHGACLQPFWTGQRGTAMDLECLAWAWNGAWEPRDLSHTFPGMFPSSAGLD